jgi:putative ABC transport system permease protein
LGYRRIEIALPYFQSVVGMAFVMLIIGYVLGTYLAEPLKAMYLDFYILPRVQIAQDAAVFATAIFVPLFFFGLFSGIVIYRMLGESSLALLKPHETATLNWLTRYVGRLLRKSRGSTKFKYLHALRSTGSFVVFFIGIMFSTILITFAFMMDGMVDRMTVGSLDSVAYQFQAYADFSKRIPDPKAGEEKFLVYPYAYVGEKVVSLQGLYPDNALYNLYGVDGRNITTRIRNNVVITRSLGLRLGIGEGDRIRVRVNARQHDFVVAGVADESSGDQVYLDIRTLSRLVSDGDSSTLFSGIYSMTEPSSEYYSAIISKKGLLEQSQAMATYTDFMINIMIGSSAVIAASILFVLTAFTVERNYFSISLLKVLGYSRREVNSMILDSYLVYSLLSYALSVPIALAALDGLMRVFLEEYDLVIPLEFRPLDAVKGLVVVVGIFLAGTYASRRKIERIPLQEVLKTYGE